MKKLLIAGTIAAMLLPSGIASAQAGPGSPRPRGDNISRSDMIARADQMFAQIDRNRDGRITRVELARAPKPDAKRMPSAAMSSARAPRPAIQDFDRNRDGLISKAEFRAHALERFAAHDGNRNRSGPGDHRNGNHR